MRPRRGADPAFESRGQANEPEDDFGQEDFAQPRKAPLGAALAIDLGDKTIGLAVSDALGITAQGLDTLERHGGKRDLAALRAICDEREIVRVVVGLPRNMDGSEGPRAEKSRAFARTIHDDLGLPVFLWDERLTTAEAERVLIAADVSRRKRAEVIDKLAAQLILQGWLEAGCPEHDAA